MSPVLYRSLAGRGGGGVLVGFLIQLTPVQLDVRHRDGAASARRKAVSAEGSSLLRIDCVPRVYMQKPGLLATDAVSRVRMAAGEQNAADNVQTTRWHRP